MQLQNVELVFSYSRPSGEEIIVKANIDEDGNWEQYGATKEELGVNVSLIEEIQEVVSQYLVS